MGEVYLARLTRLEKILAGMLETLARAHKKAASATGRLF